MNFNELNFMDKLNWGAFDFAMANKIDIEQSDNPPTRDYIYFYIHKKHEQKIRNLDNFMDDSFYINRDDIKPNEIGAVNNLRIIIDNKENAPDFAVSYQFKEL